MEQYLSLVRNMWGGNYQTKAGGSAVNSAKMMASLGFDVLFVGKTGDDKFSFELEKDLENCGVTTLLIKESGFQTNLGINLANVDGEVVMFVVGNSNQSLSEDDLYDVIKNKIKSCDVIYLGGIYKLKNLSISFYQKLIGFAHKNNTKVALDHGRIPADLSGQERKKIKTMIMSLDKSDYYFPSEDEYQELWGISLNDYPYGLNLKFPTRGRNRYAEPGLSAPNKHFVNLSVT